MNYRLAVGARVVDVAALFKPRAKLRVVVNLSVEDEPHARLNAAAHRLVARAREVNDCEPSEAEAQTAFVKHARARVVRPTVLDAVAHALDDLDAHAPRLGP